MGIIRKYAFELVLALAVIYVYAPLALEDVAKLRWLDDLNVTATSPSHPQSRKRAFPQSTQSPQRMSTRTWTIELPNG